MTVTIGSWLIPVGATLVLLGLMFRPYRSSGDYDFGFIFRILWLIPVCLVWAAYFGILLYLKSRHG